VDESTPPDIATTMSMPRYPEALVAFQLIRTDERKWRHDMAL
jgi:hypothetical protein